MTSHLPVQFDKYTRIVKESEELFGERYRAFDSELDRPVTLRMPDPELLRDPAFVEQFRQEAHAATQLDHPNIVHVFSLGEHKDAPFLEMEAVEGQSLAKLIADKGIFRPLEALPIVDAICAALQEAHSKGIIHGNLTPHDVLLRASDNRILVSDFGLAKAVDGSLQAELGSKKKQIAALRYMSPEQVNRQVGAIGAPSDLYSLGVILYEMLTGEIPFVGKSVEELVQAHTSEAPEAPSKINTNLNQAIESVVLKALAKHPQERFSSAQEMAEAFRAAVSEEAAIAPADPPPPATRLSDPVPSPDLTPPAKPSRPLNAPSPVVAEPSPWSMGDTGIIALFVVAAFVTWIFWNSRDEPSYSEPRRNEPTPPSYYVQLTPTPLPSAQPTADPTISDVVGTTPIRYLGFENDPEYWSYSADAYEHEVVGDELVITVHASNHNTWSIVSVNSTNYYAEVEVTMEDSADVSAGIGFNYQDDDNFYLFLTDPDGYYSVWRLVNGEWETVLSWTQSSLLQTGVGATNLLGIHMDGDNVRLVVNRNSIGEIDTIATPAGGMALYVETYAATEAVTRFGNFRWWDFSMPSSSDIASVTARTPTGVFDFREDPEQWSSSDDAASQAVIDSKLEITLHESEWQSWQTLELEGTDYYFEADLTIHSQSDQIMAGLLFDVTDDDNFYAVSIDVDGHYAIQQRSGGEWTDIQDWIYSPLLQPGSETINSIGVMAHENKFWITANGQVLDTVDVTPSTGGVGLIAGTYDEPEGKASFDNVRWWDLTGVVIP